MKTLIVEDDFLNRFLLNKLLSEYGKVDTVVNGIEAINAFELAHKENSKYDLILLDIMMPEMDGIQALKIIRQKEKEMQIPPKDEVKIIMITALDTPHDVIESYYQGGCNAYLVKPILRKKLLDILKEFRLIPE